MKRPYLEDLRALIAKLPPVQLELFWFPPTSLDGSVWDHETQAWVRK